MGGLVALISDIPVFEIAIATSLISDIPVFGDAIAASSISDIPAFTCTISMSSVFEILAYIPRPIPLRCQDALSCQAPGNEAFGDGSGLRGLDLLGDLAVEDLLDDLGIVDLLGDPAVVDVSR